MLPYSRQSIDKDDIEAVKEALSADYLTGGPKVAEFEKSIATNVDSAFAVACAKGL